MDLLLQVVLVFLHKVILELIPVMMVLVAVVLVVLDNQVLQDPIRHMVE